MNIHNKFDRKCKNEIFFNKKRKYGDLFLIKKEKMEIFLMGKLHLIAKSFCKITLVNHFLSISHYTIVTFE